MAKVKTPLSELKKLSKKITNELKYWQEEYKNGCNDPFWSDGVNLNLVRNHVIYYKKQIFKLCEDNNLKVPQEYFISIPLVDNNYFAKPNSERAIRIIRDYGLCLNTKETNNIGNNEQLRLF